jgi:predicted metal-dependent HD superfamily phosphohydrolase
MDQGVVLSSLAEDFLVLATSHAADRATAEAWWRELESHYSEPHRRYHTIEHIRELLALLPQASEDVLGAVWFHDVIYDRRGANEERSADLAHEALVDLHFPRTSIDRVTKMILATRDHDPGDLPEEARLFLDADLAILGSPRERYREYAEAIRFEYFWVPDDVFRAARDGVLRQFLANPFIYRTEAMRQRFEDQARDNIAWELRGFASSS